MQDGALLVRHTFFCKSFDVKFAMPKEGICMGTLGFRPRLMGALVMTFR
jgi:hypothetical protein